eukprot:jgi/Chlat1/4700/Chrsp3S05626
MNAQPPAGAGENGHVHLNGVAKEVVEDVAAHQPAPTGGKLAATVIADAPVVANGHADSNNDVPVKRKGLLGFYDSLFNKPKKEKSKAVPFFQLFRYADNTDKLLMLLGSIGAILAGATMPSFAILFGRLSDSFGSNALKDGVACSSPEGQDTLGNLVHDVNKYALILFLLAIVTWIVSYLEVGFWMLTGERQSARIRQKYLQAVLRQDVGYFDTEVNTGSLVSHITGDTITIQDGLGEKVGNFLHHLTTFVTGYSVGFIYAWKLTFVMIAITPLIAFAGSIMAVALTSSAKKGQEAYAEAGGVAEQSISCIRTVKAFGGEQKAWQSYSDALAKSLQSGKRNAWQSGFGLAFTYFTFYGTCALALWYGSKLIIDDGQTGGDILATFFAVLIAGFGIGQGTPHLGKFAAAQAAAYNVFQTIERHAVIDVSDLSGETPAAVRGEVTLTNIRFAYPSRPEQVIFNNFNLVVKPGETVALVGESGSGKSTVVSLVERFYDPLEGSVMLDGVELKRLQLKWLREHIGLVSQEPALFATTIRKNIEFGKPAATMDEIISACKSANAHNFISSLPDGYETQVGERGVQLSGGQKQRIAIARAVLKDPRILLLDEATSALDTESERVVQEALDKLMVGRTTIVIAHRLSTIRTASRICVVQRGSIIEEGTHHELISRPDSAYSALVRLQEASAEKNRAALEAAESAAQEEAKVLAELDSRGLIKRVSESGSQQLHSTGIVRRNSAQAVEPELEDPVKGATVPQKKGFFARFKKQKADGVEEEKKKKKYAPVSAWRVVKMSEPEWWRTALGAAAAGLNGCIYPAFAIVFAQIITVFYEPPNQLADDARFWSLMFVVIAVASFNANFWQLWGFITSGSYLTRRIRELAFKAVLRQEVAWFDSDNNSSGGITGRLESDAALVKAVLGDRLGLFVQNVTTLIAGIIIAFITGWRLALVVLAIFPLIAIGGYLQMEFFKGFTGEAQKLQEKANGVASEAVGNIRTVAAFGAEDKMLELYSEQLKKPTQLGRRRSHVSGIGFGYSQFMMYSAYSLAFWFGGIMAKQCHMTFDEVLRTFFAIIFSALGVGEASQLAPDVAKGQAAMESTFDIVDRQPAMDMDDPNGVKLPHIQGNIDLKNVTFVYPSRPNAIVFRNLSLSVKAGESIALVGESGSGKSTVVSLVERFYDPVDGEVLLDGVNIKTFNLRWLRMNIGLVSQEPVLFATTIRQNILYGREDATQHEVEAASRAANAHDFISRLPNGYDTHVGERGVQMSGGQKQRIAIARAVIKDPRILLLDEATSALDTESEAIVQEALDRLMVGRTTVVVAHRLSTIRHCNRIAVVQRGVIIEEGTHEELISRPNGAFAALARARKDVT